MNQDYAERDVDKVNMSNIYFSNLNKLNDCNNQLLYLHPALCCLESIVISVIDVKDAIFILKVTKACSPEQITPRILTESAFSTVHNRSLQQGYFLPAGKEANISPIHKKGDKSFTQ